MSDNEQDDQASKRRQRLQVLRAKKPESGELEAAGATHESGAGQGEGGRRGALLKKFAQRRKKAGKKTAKRAGAGQGGNLDRFPRLKAAIEKRRTSAEGGGEADGEADGGGRRARLRERNKELEAEVAALKAELEASRGNKD